MRGSTVIDSPCLNKIETILGFQNLRIIYFRQYFPIRFFISLLNLDLEASSAFFLNKSMIKSPSQK